MATVAAGLCPACVNFLFIVPEEIEDDFWIWKCLKCRTMFTTDVRGQDEIEAAGAEPGRFVEPARGDSEGVDVDGEEGDVA